MTTNDTHSFSAIDFFCGGGGMTCGLEQAGIHVIAGVDYDKSVKDTYEFNNPDSCFIFSDIKRLRSSFFEEKLGIRKSDDNLIFVGCSPCQFYSAINTDRSKAKNTKNLLMSFVRFVDYYRPGYVLVENVPGIETNKDSILPKFLKKLINIGYTTIVKDVVDLSYYGVPQSRKRFSLIATRLAGVNVCLPLPEKEPSILKDFIGEANGFPRISAGHKDASPFYHSCSALSMINMRRIKKTRHNGGSRLEWSNDPELQLPCYVGKDDSFTDNYGRMAWNKPSPTITTKFMSISNGRFGHPEEDRALSVREGASIQTFPKSYVFKTTSMRDAARIIGNAVPCEYAKRLGLAIIDNHTSEHQCNKTN